MKSTDIKEFNRGLQKKIHCKICDSRLADLQKKVGRTKQFCKCGLNTHSDTCPLSCFAHRNIWPGKDNYVTKADRDFLNNVAPAWWTRRWHKKK